MTKLVRSRRTRLVLFATVAVALLAVPVARAASDVFSNVGPGSQSAGLAARYPLGNYALDQHFDAVSVSLTGGVDVSGLPALIAYFLAEVVWELTAFLANALITLFAFAFSLDLVNGSQATGGAGALAPVSDAMRSIYQSVFGEPWLVVAVTAAGLWAMWKALVQRRYTETAGALALSVVFTVIALAFVTQPERTIGQASRWTNQLSAAFLSLSSSGTLTGEQQAKQQAQDELFGLFVYDPWSVLDFGGLEHCVKAPVADPPVSVPVRPLSTNAAQDAQLSRQLRDGTDVQAQGKTCVNDRNKYAPHFLAYAPGSDARNSEYDALHAGDSSKLPDSDPGKTGGYQLSTIDKPAADAMGKGGQYHRLLLALVVLLGELGGWLLLGALSVGVLLAQVLVLLLLAFAPVALVAGVYPGRGHDLFRGWLSRLASFLLRKAIYSLILAVLLAVIAALQDATAALGWLLSFGLQALFLWTVFLYRHQLVAYATAATTGQAAPERRMWPSIATVYWASRLAHRRRRHSQPREAPHSTEPIEPRQPEPGAAPDASDVAAPGGERPSPPRDTPAGAGEATPAGRAGSRPAEARDAPPMPGPAGADQDRAQRTPERPDRADAATSVPPPAGAEPTTQPGAGSLADDLRADRSRFERRDTGSPDEPKRPPERDNGQEGRS